MDTQYNMTVLDEDEFAAEQSLTVEVREHARRALDQLSGARAAARAAVHATLRPGVMGTGVSGR